MAKHDHHGTDRGTDLSGPRGAPGGPELLDHFSRVRALCLGDVMLDVEVDCQRGRISPEAPVLVFAEGRSRSQLGGAGNVAAGVAALGSTVVLASVVGEDAEAIALGSLLDEAGIRARLLRNGQDGRVTTRKTRFVADGRQVLRIDREVETPIRDTLVSGLLALPTDQAETPDVILVSDYGKGVVTAHLMRACAAIARQSAAPILVDPKGTDWMRYGAVALIKPNAQELGAFAGLPCETDEEVERALRAALARCEARSLLVTRSNKGASLLRRCDLQVRHFAARAVEVADVCGAGDTNLAVLGVALAAGSELEQAVELAQAASAIAVRRHGNAVVSQAELRHALAFGEARGQGKLLATSDLPARLDHWRIQGLTIGFTNGCFDLLHPGHIHALEWARAQCDRLVVGLNSDASVRRLKGPSRPVQGEADRAAVLAALEMVDAVVLFEEDTPEALIALVRPDVLAKGGDYDAEQLAGAALVRDYGGKVLVSGLVPARSTSRIVETISAQVLGGEPREHAGKEQAC